MGSDTTALYRHYDADGCLLYVGIALSPIARLCEHRATSAWFWRIATVKITHYGSRDEALAAEAEAIRTECPAHNKAGVGTLPANERKQVRPLHSSRRLAKLSARGVATVTKPGYHADGGSLYLQVTATGAKSWVFRYRRNGRSRDIGLGSIRNVSLSAAREKAAKHRAQLGAGIDPLSAKHPV